ncbi:hypothetical protein PLANPX_4960 [Lacipirellula parvula]|uniref:Uncharacterized protein n=1 Tax=Lacipirellula parvula TaxID=2650471 RepID=A0A5K7XFQ6_9BACT|nr:hypothetical protein PLANPX_4960 [Lacipirellula parvula]
MKNRKDSRGGDPQVAAAQRAAGAVIKEMSNEECGMGGN